MLCLFMLSVIVLCFIFCYAECHIAVFYFCYAECHIAVFYFLLC
jgi:hypothetical protein